MLLKPSAGWDSSVEPELPDHLPTTLLLKHHHILSHDHPASGNREEDRIKRNKSRLSQAHHVQNLGGQYLVLALRNCLVVSRPCSHFCPAHTLPEQLALLTSHLKQGDVYAKVINDVCEHSRQDFEEGGVELATLDLLRSVSRRFSHHCKSRPFALHHQKHLFGKLRHLASIFRNCKCILYLLEAGDECLVVGHRALWALGERGSERVKAVGRRGGDRKVLEGAPF